jgi:hypothetical protein
VAVDFAAFLGALKADKDKSVLRDNSVFEEEKKPEDSDLEKTDMRKKLLRPRKSLDEE